MIKKLTLLGILSGIFFLQGCTIPINATKIGPNEYTLSDSLRQRLYRDATIFCTQKNLSLKPVRERTVQGRLALDFKCLSEDSELYKSNTTYEAPDNVLITPKN